MKRPWLFHKLRERYEHPLEVEAYAAQVAEGLLREEEAVLEGFCPRPSHILNLGCGAGREAIALAKMGHRVAALDISRSMLDVARRLGREQGAEITWIWMRDPLTIPLPDNRFDCAVAFAQLLSHIPGRDARVRLLAEIARCLRPGALFIGTVTHRKALRDFVGEQESLDEGPGDDRLEKLAGWEDGDLLVWDPSEAKIEDPLFFHLHTPEEIKEEVSEAGLEFERIVEAAKLTPKPACDAHRYPFVVARKPS